MAGEGEDLSLKVLQLECIIDAKSREIQLLREQLSEDQEEAIQQLQQENNSLREQLNKQTAVGARAPVSADGAVTADVKRAAAQAASVLQHSSAALSQLLHELQKVETAPAAAEPQRQSAALDQLSAADRIIQLNVSGTHLAVPLSVLQQVPGSKLAAMFSPSTPQQQQQQQQQQQSMLLDHDGRYFLPFEPEAVERIISVMQARSVFNGSSSSRYYLQVPQPHEQQQQQQQQGIAVAAGVTDILSESCVYMRDLVNHLGLQSLLHPETGHADVSRNVVPMQPQQQQQQQQQQQLLHQLSGGHRRNSPAAGSSRSSNGTAPDGFAEHMVGRSITQPAAAGSSKSADPAAAAAPAAATVADHPGRTAAIQALQPRTADNAVAAAVAEPAAAAHAAALQALLPKRPDTGSGDGSSTAAASDAAAVTSAALKGLTPHKR